MNFKELKKQINDYPSAREWNLRAIEYSYKIHEINEEQKNLLLDLVHGRLNSQNKFLNEFPIEIDENKISNLLNSDKFISEILKFKETCREKALEYSIIYLSLQRDGYGFFEFLDSLHTFENELEKFFGGIRNWFSLLVCSVAKRLNLDMPLTEESENKIFDFFNKIMKENGIYFHSFNGCFEESIRKNGIDPAIRLWDWNDINKINNIFSKYGRNMICGWVDVNCKQKTSLSEYPFYRYAVASPEWFAQFIAEGYHHLGEGVDKNCFYKRDYIAAKKNMMLFCKKIKELSDSEENEIMAFFENYWNVFASIKSIPKIAFVLKKRLFSSSSNSLSLNEYKKHLKGYDFNKMMYIIFNPGNDINKQIDYIIPKSEIYIIDLPKYVKIFPEEAFSKKI